MFSAHGNSGKCLLWTVEMGHGARGPWVWSYLEGRVVGLDIVLGAFKHSRSLIRSFLLHPGYV